MTRAREETRADVAVAVWDELEDRKPVAAYARGVHLVVVRFDDRHSVLSGRCQHRNALMADGVVRGDDLICGVHSWDYRIDTGISTYNPSEHLHRFQSEVVDGVVKIWSSELEHYRVRHGIASDGDEAPNEYDVHYTTAHDTEEEPFVGEIHRLARRGLTSAGPHGAMTAMGVPRKLLPSWDDLQFVTAQLARRPLLDDEPVGTDVVIGPNAERPLHLEIPLFISDMSFGSLSAEAKIALARGAERAGTGICSGEGGMLPEEHAENSRYFYELASARFGWSPDLLDGVQAFHLKFGQAAKTGTGGHLPGRKVKGRIAEVRGLPEGTAAVSPATFPDFHTVDDVRDFMAGLREVAGGIPFGVKLSAQRIEEDIDAALEIGVDYIILDGRGGGTGAAPKLLRDHISVPTIPALARARRHGGRVGVLHFDVDRFKTINDSMGHAIGDQMLRAVATRVAEGLRGSDAVARLGGDDFAVLVDDTADAAGIRQVAERLMSALRQPFVVDGRELWTTVSMGISVFPDDGATAERLLEQADVAMYRAKDLGRNRVCSFDGGLRAEVSERTELDQAVAGQTPLEATDHLGVVSRVWPVTDVKFISALTKLMGPKPIFIADGHHLPPGPPDHGRARAYAPLGPRFCPARHGL